MSAPSALAQWCLLRVTRPGDLQELEGDLSERFARWLEARGLSLARRRYWREVFFLAGWRMVGTSVKPVKTAGE